MPELPEVETTRRGLAPHLIGEAAGAVAVRCGRLREPIPDELGVLLGGHRLLSLARRGKYLLFGFAHGTLIVHLGMSGSLRLVPPHEPPERHDHVDVAFGAWILRYRDPRRFGLIVWHPGAPESCPRLARLGVEPLGGQFDGRMLQRCLEGARLSIKQALMDGKRIVGVGNIYACESLHRACIHPLTPAGELGPRVCDRLADAVRVTLEAAIAAGGSTLRDFVGGDGQAGYFQLQTRVYGREGEPCLCCGTTVMRVVAGQRGTWFCPSCQPRRRTGNKAPKNP